MNDEIMWLTILFVGLPLILFLTIDTIQWITKKEEEMMLTRVMYFAYRNTIRSNRFSLRSFIDYLILGCRILVRR